GVPRLPVRIPSHDRGGGGLAFGGVGRVSLSGGANGFRRPGADPAGGDGWPPACAGWDEGGAGGVRRGDSGLRSSCAGVASAVSGRANGFRRTGGGAPALLAIAADGRSAGRRVDAWAPWPLRK